MNKIFRTLWNPTLGTWVAAPEISRGLARSSGTGGVRAIAAAALVACVVPVLAAGGAGGQPVGDTRLNGGAGGSDGSGGSGGFNDTIFNAFGGAGGASMPGGGATAGAGASIGSFGTATPGAGGAAGAASTSSGPGVFQGDAGGAGQAQTGGPGAGDGYGGGGGGGFQGASIANNIPSSSDSYTGGAGGASGDGYWAAGGGGAGGYGAVLNGPLGNYTATGSSAGGAGGQGGNAFSQGGGGGSGGGGFYLNATTPGLGVTNTGTLAGGAGGAGGAELAGSRANASGGGGGAGGIGATLAGAAVVFSNMGAITGGAGGAGGASGGGAGGTGSPGGGGDGGAGLASIGAGATLTNTGVIAGGAGGAGGANSNGGPAGANGAGGVGVTGAGLALINGGVISGGLGGDGVTRAAAVAFTGGANSLTLRTGTSMTGAISIGTGATASVIADVDGLAVDNALLLGGTGTIDTRGHDLAWSGAISGASDLVKSGAGVLTLSGADTHTGGTLVAAGTLRAGAANVLSSGSAYTVALGAALDLAGNSQAIASMANSGTVSLVGAVPGTTLTVNGPWAGNGGTLRLGTSLGGSASASDRLILSGATAIASGTTRVQITNLGGLGALTTGNGIEVISAINGATTTAQTTRSAFNLAGGHVDAGAYEYRLYAADASGAGENWYLRSTAAAVAPPGGGTGIGTGAGGLGGVPTYRAEVPLYAALPEQLRQSSLAMLGNMHQRTGDDLGAASSTATATPAQGYRQAWGRIISTDRTISQGGTVSPTSKGRLTGFQAGTDLWADPNFRVGVYVGRTRRRHARERVRERPGEPRSGHQRPEEPVPGRLHHLEERQRPVRRRRAAGRPPPLHRLAHAGLEPCERRQGQQPAGVHRGGPAVRHRAELDHRAAGATGAPTHVNLGDTSIPGALVQQDSHNGTLARAGVRVKGQIATGAGLLQPYVRANVYRSSKRHRRHPLRRPGRLRGHRHPHRRHQHRTGGRRHAAGDRQHRACTRSWASCGAPAATHASRAA
jgi:hypothetical protein